MRNENRKLIKFEISFPDDRRVKPCVIDVSDGTLDVFASFPLEEFNRIDRFARDGNCHWIYREYVLEAVYDDGSKKNVPLLGMDEYSACGYFDLICCMIACMEHEMGIKSKQLGWVG